MDDYELDRIASDNPALTAPALERMPLSRRKSHVKKQAPINGSSSSQNSATNAELTKYDVCITANGMYTELDSLSRSAGEESYAISRHPGSASPWAPASYLYFLPQYRSKQIGCTGSQSYSSVSTSYSSLALSASLSSDIPSTQRSGLS